MSDKPLKSFQSTQPPDLRAVLNAESSLDWLQEWVEKKGAEEYLQQAMHALLMKTYIVYALVTGEELGDNEGDDREYEAFDPSI